MADKGKEFCLKAGGCLGCGVLVLGIGIYLVVRSVTASLPKFKIDPKMQRELDGESYAFRQDPARFDPFAVASEIRPRVGANARLLRIEARYVKSDGTMNLNATYEPAPEARYRFSREAPPEPGKEAPPIGAAGRQAGDVWLERSEVVCYRPGKVDSYTVVSGYHNQVVSHKNKGMDFQQRSSPAMGRLEEDLGDPKVSTADLWKIALAEGAPKEGVATIIYDRGGYQFAMPGFKNLYFDKSGKLKR